ncbi:Glycoside hydrolase family 131 protein [Pleurostoma richardsiae]|uniref:Glycoside hydrolase family 131 protein n=1 Tax=Pleurostoma richardsiae TaxID=41990 RepID=A0AA38RMG7_9PEZI|nr:Glycoside hydrolase family 131 protein [Pleurostoma richardsiae]
MKLTSALFAVLASLVDAAVIWDGRFNDFTSSADLNKWSWSSQVGPYQYYIHGSGTVDKYVNLSPDYKNPNDTVSKQGAKFTLDSTAFWNGQNMRRTELIPQTTAGINKGKVYYHFSMLRKDANAPSVNREHQICFFESHFTEMKYGWISGEQGTSNPNLQWMVQQKSLWKTEWKPSVWHNIAYEIDFSANKVGFWHSEDGDPLKQVVAPVSGSTSSNGADWHLGVLELPRSGYSDTTEDFYYSGVYIESGSITTTIGGPQ